MFFLAQFLDNKPSTMLARNKLNAQHEIALDFVWVLCEKWKKKKLHSATYFTKHVVLLQNVILYVYINKEIVLSTYTYNFFANLDQIRIKKSNSAGWAQISVLWRILYGTWLYMCNKNV